MEWYAIYEIPRGGCPVMLERFDTESEALAWVAGKSGEYALFSKHEGGWAFLPVK